MLNKENVGNKKMQVNSSGSQGWSSQEMINNIQFIIYYLLFIINLLDYNLL
jgi:hypothetical protein